MGVNSYTGCTPSSHCPPLTQLWTSLLQYVGGSLVYVPLTVASRTPGKLRKSVSLSS